MPEATFHAVQRSDSRGNIRWVHFAGYAGRIEARSPEEVLPALREAEAARVRGLNAVGWIAYEAAPGFDPALPAHPPAPDRPLLRFTLYREQFEGLPPRSAGTGADTSPSLRPQLDQEQFTEKIARIHAAIADGETYQVNFTYPLLGTFAGDPWTLFRRLRFAQSARHQAFFEEPDAWILSASPERFFVHQGNRITCRPMKGTSPIGGEDLLMSPKNRAENIMIVDMIRNDLGKIADPGSVITRPLFEVERYPSLSQLTSTIQAAGPESAVDWLQALFPCASITGAPKRNTMRWIRDLEAGPRGMYTGAIGGMYADGISDFNVAIRTLVIDRETGNARYSTGCGIVWDSQPDAEYEESLLKTSVLAHESPPFALIETMRGGAEGIPLWELHRQRFLRSAAILGLEMDNSALEQRIAELKVTAPSRIRFTLSTKGEWTCEVSPLPASVEVIRFALDNRPTPSDHPEFAHKTTRRGIYDRARERHPEAEETLLVNERGELIEFCIGTVVLEIEGQHWTPPLSSGGLAGVGRAQALREGQLRERVLTETDLNRADQVYLLNALRGRVPARRV